MIIFLTLQIIILIFIAILFKKKLYSNDLLKFLYYINVILIFYSLVYKLKNKNNKFNFIYDTWDNIINNNIYQTKMNTVNRCLNRNNNIIDFSSITNTLNRIIYIKYNENNKFNIFLAHHFSLQNKNIILNYKETKINVLLKYFKSDIENELIFKIKNIKEKFKYNLILINFSNNLIEKIINLKFDFKKFIFVNNYKPIFFKNFKGYLKINCFTLSLEDFNFINYNYFEKDELINLQKYFKINLKFLLYLKNNNINLLNYINKNILKTTNYLKSLPISFQKLLIKWNKSYNFNLIINYKNKAIIKKLIKKQLIKIRDNKIYINNPLLIKSIENLK